MFDFYFLDLQLYCVRFAVVVGGTVLCFFSAQVLYQDVNPVFAFNRKSPEVCHHYGVCGFGRGSCYRCDSQTLHWVHRCVNFRFTGIFKTRLAGGF